MLASRSNMPIETNRVMYQVRSATAVVATYLTLSPLAYGQLQNECTDRWCNWDYYSATADPDRANTLRNEEKFHLSPGIQQLYQRQYGVAWAEFLHILRVFPNHPVALDRLSQLCESWKHPKCSEGLDERFERAITVNPGAAGTYAVIGIAQLRSKKPKLAVESCKKALKINPNSVNAHYTLGLAYFELKQYSLANEHAQKAYGLGAPLPGLRDKLRSAGQWKPSASPAAGTPAPAAETGKPAAVD